MSWVYWLPKSRMRILSLILLPIPIPMRWAFWKILPSVLMEGAMMISVVCISRIVEAPTEPMQVRRAPTRFCEPSSRREGP